MLAIVSCVQDTVLEGLRLWIGFVFFFVLFVHRRMRSRVRPCWNVALTERVLVYSKEPAAGNKDVAVSKKPEVL